MKLKIRWYPNGKVVKDKNKQRLSIDICIKSMPENVDDNNKMFIFCKIVFVEKDNFALSHIIDIADMNDENFDEEINKEYKTLIVDFWAEWCGPCKLLSPIIEEVAKELEDQVTFGKVNLDSNQDLAMRLSIRSIPTLLMFKDGKLRDTTVCLLSKSDLQDWILSSN